MKLSIIIVNYNGGNGLASCLSSIYRETEGITFEVILVDNASTDGSVELVEKNFPNVSIIRNAQNKGFAAANNIAIQEAAGEFILMLNADTEILDGAIQKTVAFMEGHPPVGIAGCKLVYPDRRVQPSVRGYPSVMSAFLDATFLYLLLPKGWMVRGKGVCYFDSSKAQEVDWVIGAYFMIRRGVIDTIGLLDEQFWLYGEENDYCQRAKNSGFETWYIPHAVVVHQWAGMTAFSLRVIVWLHIGQKLYADKHYHGARKFLIIYLRYVGAALRVIVYPVVACITLNKRLFAKAYFYGVALFKMLTQRWKYRHGHVGEVIPWTRYL